MDKRFVHGRLEGKRKSERFSVRWVDLITKITKMKQGTEIIGKMEYMVT